MTKTGVILTGGGARAAYQVGVLRAVADMYPDWHYPFNVIIGTSAGAINAMALAGSRGLFRHNIDHLDRVWSELTLDHIMASSAIPTLFPPVRINREYFGDGATRQMAHISPALRLGARKVMVVGVSANQMSPVRRPDKPDMPTMSQVLGHVFNGIFLDTLDYDIDRSRIINQLLELIPPERLKEAGLDLNPVEILEISPSQPIDEIAAKYVDGMPLILRRLAGASDIDGDSSASLASFLLFDRRFCKDLINLGYRDGQNHARQIERFFSGARVGPESA